MFLFSLLFPIGLYSFSFFEEKPASETSVSKPIIIEPIVIPSSVKEESNAEILNKLKEVTKEVFKNAEPSEDEVAEEVLGTLKVLAKSRTLEEEKNRLKRERIRKKKLAEKRERIRKKKLAEKRERIRKKKLAEKRERIRKKKLAEKRERIRKKKLAQKRERIRKKKLAEKRERIRKKKLAEKRERIRKKKLAEKRESRKKTILLGVQPSMYTLSKEQEKGYQHLEVVSQSQPFVLEREGKVKNPKQYQGTQKEVEFDALPWVETLGVVKVSKPFLKPQ
jgi:hypothetical protein